MTSTAISIGTFDGVHRGHVSLVRRARARVGETGSVVVLSFDPHPMSVLRPAAAPERLTTFSSRERLLLACGADRVIRLDPASGILDTDASEFVRQLCAEHNPVAIVEGPDFRFGRARLGDSALLTELGSELGFEAIVVPPERVALRDQTVVTASSSMTRWLIASGRVRDAALVLGRPYELDAVTVSGDRRGRSIGYPTANLETACAIPADGVYAGRLALDDGRVFTAAVSVGNKPTFGDRPRCVEAYLLDVGEGDSWTPLPGLPEYGWRSRLSLIGWVRDQVRFDSVTSLVEQLKRDCVAVRDIIGRGHVLPEAAGLEVGRCP